MCTDPHQNRLFPVIMKCEKTSHIPYRPWTKVMLGVISNILVFLTTTRFGATSTSGSGSGESRFENHVRCVRTQGAAMGSIDRYQASPTRKQDYLDYKPRSDTNCFPCSLAVTYFFRVTTLCLICMVVATICFYGVRHQICGTTTNDIIDALYFTVVLITSAGYKDLTPISAPAMLFAILFSILGVGLIGALVIVCGEFLIDMHPGPMKLFMAVKAGTKVEYRRVVIQKLKVLAVMFVLHMCVGTFLLVSFGNMDLRHGLYCTTSTITTVISVKECFSTKGGRILASIWIFYGMATLNYLLYILTEMWTIRKERVFIEKALKRDPEFKYLDPSHFDDYGFITKEGYIMFRLKLKLEGKENDVTKEPGLTNDNDIPQDSSINPSKPSYKGQKQLFHGERKDADFFRLPLDPDDAWDIAIGFCGNLYVAKDHISGKKTNDILDTFYFSLVIMTSVGYGDLSVDDYDALGLLLASIFSISGIVLIGLILSSILKVLAKEQEMTLLRDNLSGHELPTSKELKEMSKKYFKIIMFFLMVLMAIGTAILFLIEPLDFIYAFYCISTTISSASAGDCCFSTKQGRSFAIVWILLCSSYKGYVVFTFTRLYTLYIQLSKLKSSPKAKEFDRGESEAA
ncbi:hypothetical protein OSB04_004027 [Centaurea solstitialis]|uniref:Potassium channel domain-containing protein n=1 Tax=Centaurea solstitialis TaxID=347529 RepID=A0AA38U6G8_9ASTR|nr:hypothetical protein OSB04_004027 [Centaurea solstitialis]